MTQQGPINPSGRQVEIASGEQRAVLVEVGGGVRSYVAGGRELLDGYAEDEMCTGARGLPLVPWPNRVGDGAYHWDGKDLQLALTEPKLHNAIHGLLRWQPWDVREHDADRAVLGAVIHPQMGYPFSLDVTIEYALGRDGLTVRTTARNVGAAACPYAVGQHPYLAAGPDALVDGCTVELAAAAYLPTDDRGLPTGRDPVEGTPFDLRTAREIGAQEIDNTYTDLTRDAGGRAWVRFTAADGVRVGVWAGEAYPYLEIYTAHTQPAPHHRTGLGVEPMTCPPDAYRSGTDLQRLEPGQETVAEWGIAPS